MLFVGYAPLTPGEHTCCAPWRRLAQDQDLQLGGLTPMTKLNRLLTQQGTTFINAFVHTPM